MLFCTTAVCAYDFEVDGIYYNITSVADLTVAVTSGDTKYSGEIVIPSTVTCKSRIWSVTSIGDYAFYYCDALEDVYINSLESWCNIDFETWANPLNYADNLYLNGELVEELVIPDSVTEIKNETFVGCGSITSVTIGDSVTSIGYFAFQNCINLTSVTIGRNVTNIEGYAFAYCSNLWSITSKARIAPTITYYTFYGIGSGTLYYPKDSDYSTWLSTNSYYLGYYEWEGRPSEDWEMPD